LTVDLGTVLANDQLDALL